MTPDHAPLDVSESLRQAILDGDLETATRLLDRRPDLLNPSLWPVAILQAGSVAMTRFLLDRGLHPDLCSAPRKALHFAVCRGSTEIAGLLLERGASPDVVDGEQITPIELAAGAVAGERTPRADEMIALLVAAGARVTAFTRMLLRDDAAVLAEIASDPDFLHRRGWIQFPPLAAAARAARPRVVEALLAAGAAVDGVEPSTHGNTALWFACQSAADASERIAVAGLLLEAGANPNRPCEEDSTPLHFAAWRGPAGLVELLLRHGAFTWNTDTHGKTALDFAKESAVAPDREAIVSLLSEVRLLDPLFRSAVGCVDRGDVETLRTLVAANPALLTQRAEEEGWFAGKYFTRPTLLHFVANNPYRHPAMPPRVLETCAALLEAGAQVDAFTEGDDPHTTLALVASCEPARAENLQIPLIDLLVRHGSDPSIGLNAALLHFEMAAVQFLLRRGARHTLLSAAACGETVLLREKLAAHPPKETLLRAAHAAALHGRTASVEILLDAGVGVNDRIPHPYAVTLLHDAAQRGHAGLARRLVERGADATVRDSQFQGTPADWAAHNGHPELAEWLAAESPADDPQDGE